MMQFHSFSVLDYKFHDNLILNHILDCTANT